MMKRSFLVVAFAVVSCVGLVVPAFAGQRRSRRPPVICRLGGSHGRGWRRVAADGEAEVYLASEMQYAYSVFGCVYGRYPYWLGLPQDHAREELGPFAYEMVLDGAIVAFESVERGYTGGSEASRQYVMVVDLRDRRVVHKVPTGSPPARPVSVGSGDVTSMVVKRDGSVAWIASNFREAQATEAPYYQVHAVDKNGERLLASGNGVAPHSLALSGNTIYWTQEGKPYSAPLN